MTRMKTFAVRFAERTFYVLPVEARSKDEAIHKAMDCYNEHGPDPAVGFDIDLSDGGTDDWEAIEVPA